MPKVHFIDSAVVIGVGDFNFTGDFLVSIVLLSDWSNRHPRANQNPGHARCLLSERDISNRSSNKYYISLIFWGFLTARA